MFQEKEKKHYYKIFSQEHSKLSDVVNLHEEQLRVSMAHRAHGPWDQNFCLATEATSGYNPPEPPVPP